MTFGEWWNENYADARTEAADRTFGEEVWNAAQRAKYENAAFNVELQRELRALLKPHGVRVVVSPTLTFETDQAK